MKYIRITLLVAASLLTVFAIAACGDDDEEEDGGNGAPAATSPADDGDDATPEVTDEAGDTGGATDGADDEVQVEMADFSFDPNTIQVPAEVPVKIEARSVGAAPHTLTVYTDEEFTDAVQGADTGTIAAGEDGDFTATFDAGEYYFRCEVHPGQMQGELTAE
jgi:plastocyanin